MMLEVMGLLFCCQLESLHCGHVSFFSELSKLSSQTRRKELKQFIKVPLTLTHRILLEGQLNQSY